MKLSDLEHLEIIADNGASIFILDKWEIIDSEAEAMLQALHSRSIGWIKSHLKVLEGKGADNFMSKFYVWYWHKSIWDCGSITIFIEWVSMLTAKAIQDSKLYSWQESSTRYLDFSKQDIINPLWNEKWKEILEKQREFYLSILEPIEENLKTVFPIWANELEKFYNKAIKAKTFDIARWFLPAWTSTNLAWHSNLRQISDRLWYLRNHPLKEVREIATGIEKAVIKKYPNSFSFEKFKETENYLKESMKQYYYHNLQSKEFQILKDDIDKKELKEQKAIFNNRPNGKTELPVWLNNLWTLKFEFLLDFWSFRDIQRHRAIYQRMPLLTNEIWFNDWYFSQLPKYVLERAKIHLTKIEELTNNLNLSSEEKQYYIPMWYNISNHLMWTLPWIVYMTELRTSKHVHQTLRNVAQKIWEYIEKKHDIKLFTDKSWYGFDVNRWKHDISIK